jgi:hypothetical protein
VLAQHPQVGGRSATEGECNSKSRHQLSESVSWPGALNLPFAP